MTKPYVAVKPQWLTEEDGDKETLYAVSNLTRRQLQVLIGLLGMSGTDNEQKEGYAVYDSIFDSAVEVAGFEHSELSPYTVFDLPQPDPLRHMAAAIDAARENGRYGGTAT